MCVYVFALDRIVRFQIDYGGSIWAAFRRHGQLLLTLLRQRVVSADGCGESLRMNCYQIKSETYISPALLLNRLN